MPSAIVGVVATVTGSPARIDDGYAAAFSAWTPMTLISRPSRSAVPFTARAMPAITPPPPIGTTTLCRRPAPGR